MSLISSLRTFLLAATFVFLMMGASNLSAQCSRVSTCGYTLYQQFTILNIVPSSTSCPSGYNYNVRFSYSLTVIGTNTCYNGSIGIQPEFKCNSGQNNGYYTITMDAPIVGAGSTTTTATGTLVTTTNPYRSASDCATVTPTSLACVGLSVTTYGPGMSSSKNSCTIQILPVKLIDFSVTSELNQAVLKWRTASEENSDYFQINKYDERTQDWVEIGKVPAAGESNRILHYSFTDNQLQKGINYYQLQQFDKDGSYAFSQIVFTDAQSESKSNATIAIDNEIPLMVKGRYSIYSINGQLVQSGETNQSPIPSTQLLPGFYLLHVENDNGFVPYRLFKSE